MPRFGSGAVGGLGCDFLDTIEFVVLPCIPSEFLDLVERHVFIDVDGLRRHCDSVASERVLRQVAVVRLVPDLPLGRVCR